MVRAIKHVAHRVWTQGVANMPPHLRQMCDGFDELHTDWDIQWWSDERIRDELDLREAAGIYANAAEHVPHHAVNQMRADIARYAILRQHGGVTLDCDYHWRDHIDDLIRGRNVVLCYERDNSWIANGFMAANPKHTLFTRILAGIPAQAAALDGKGLSANTYTGPKYITPIIRALGPRDDLRILPAKTLHPVPWNRATDADNPGRYPDSVAVHAWSHRRGIEGVDGGIWKTWTDEPVAV